MKPIPAALLFGGGSGGSDPIAASSVTYDGTSSGLSSENVQDAIDEVNEKIEEQPKPMVYKGTLGTGGTITSLPTASSDNEGHVYKVKTEDDYILGTVYYRVTFISSTGNVSADKSMDPDFSNIVDSVSVAAPRYNGVAFVFDDNKLEVGTKDATGSFGGNVYVKSLIDGVHYNNNIYNAGEIMASGNKASNRNWGPITYGPSIHAKVGDMFISNGAEWTHIPSGDDMIIADEVTYDNTSSDLSSENVQDAINEVNSKIPSDIQAEDVTYDNTTSDLTATDVNSAIDEVNDKINELPDSVHYVGTIGTGGTIQTLPDPSSHIGELYKCIENGNYYTKEYQYSPTIKKVSGTSGQSLKRYINGVQQADNVFVAYNTDKILDGVFKYMCRYEGGSPTSIWAEYRSSIQSLVEGAQVKDTNTGAWQPLTKNITYKFINGDAPGPSVPVFKASVITHLNKDDYVFSDGFDWIKIIGIPESKDIVYDNTDSGLEATDVQGAIDEVNEKAAHHYSTDEQVIGTWIDGSTLYEKTFDLGSDVDISNAQWAESGITILNLNKLIEAKSTNSNGTFYPLMATHANGAINLLACRDSQPASSRWLILQYTKTID